MIRIDCPFCGERDHSEFSYGGDASIKYPALDASIEEWHDAVFMRENIRGMQSETWHHVNGCRMWLVVERDTVTHAIASVKPAHSGYAQALAGNKKALAENKKALAKNKNPLARDKKPRAKGALKNNSTGNDS